MIGTILLIIHLDIGHLVDGILGEILIFTMILCVFAVISVVVRVCSLKPSFALKVYYFSEFWAYRIQQK